MARPRSPVFEEGKRFGKWTIIKLIGYGPKGSVYECQCDCGKISEIKGDILRAARSRCCQKCAINDARRSFK